MNYTTLFRGEGNTLRPLSYISIIRNGATSIIIVIIIVIVIITISCIVNIVIISAIVVIIVMGYKFKIHQRGVQWKQGVVICII